MTCYCYWFTGKIDDNGALLSDLVGFFQAFDQLNVHHHGGKKKKKITQATKAHTITLCTVRTRAQSGCCTVGNGKISL